MFIQWELWWPHFLCYPSPPVQDNTFHFRKSPMSSSPDFLLDRILYKDSVIIVINKPAGMPVHAGPGGGENIEQFLEPLKFGISTTPGLGHRLDRDTSGCLILGRHPKALSRLGKLFMAKRIKKRYWAIVSGKPPEDSGRIDLPLAKQTSDTRSWWMKVDESGQEAVTEYKVLGSSGNISWLELTPHTGRTHQLRVHMAEIGCPILGDKVYGDKGTDSPLQLHAEWIEIPLHHNQEPIQVSAPPPEHMLERLRECGYRG